MESQVKSLTVNTQRQALGNALHKRDLRCKKCKEKNLIDYWYCYKCCVEGHIVRFCPGKQGN